MSKTNKLYKELIKAIVATGDQVPCQQNPDYWDDETPGLDYSTRRLQIQHAKDACYDCPVIALCAEYAIAAVEPTGIWGGLSTVDREKIITKLL